MRKRPVVIAGFAVILIGGAVVITQSDRQGTAEYAPTATVSSAESTAQASKSLRKVRRDLRKLGRAGIYVAKADGRKVALVNPTPANRSFIRRKYRVPVSTRPDMTPDGPYDVCPEVKFGTSGPLRPVPNVLGKGLAAAMDSVEAAGLKINPFGCVMQYSVYRRPKTWEVDYLTRIVQQCPPAGTMLEGGANLSVIGEVRLPGGFTYRTQPLVKGEDCSGV